VIAWHSWYDQEKAKNILLYISESLEDRNVEQNNAQGLSHYEILSNGAGPVVSPVRAQYVNIDDIDQTAASVDTTAQYAVIVDHVYLQIEA
jgi:hypothetical protein